MNMRNNTIMKWLLGCTVVAAMAACQSDDPTPRPDADDVRARQVTITETETAAARQEMTRATLTAGTDLTAQWKAGDQLTYCNLSRTNALDETPYSGPLTATSSAATSEFTGSVTCSTGDYLAVVYPSATFATNESYTISLAGQDGTLATLGTRFHHVYGKALVNSVTDATADATMPKMKSLLTVCKFSFVDKENDNPLPIETLSISYAGMGADAGTYPQSAKVAIKDGTSIKDQADVHATGVPSTEPLVVSSPGAELTEVYVALLPTAAPRTYSFTLTNASGTYSGTAKATLAEGQYVVATGLKLTK